MTVTPIPSSAMCRWFDQSVGQAFSRSTNAYPESGYLSAYDLDVCKTATKQGSTWSGRHFCTKNTVIQNIIFDLWKKSMAYGSIYLENYKIYARS